MKGPPRVKGRSLRPSRRVILVGLVALLTLAAARIAAPSGASRYRFSAAMVCGIERLTRCATVVCAARRSVQRPSSLPPSSRLAFERRIFTGTSRRSRTSRSYDSSFRSRLAKPSRPREEERRPHRATGPRILRAEEDLGCAQTLAERGRRELPVNSPRIVGRGLVCRRVCPTRPPSGATRVPTPRYRSIRPRGSTSAGRHW